VPALVAWILVIAYSWWTVTAYEFTTEAADSGKVEHWPSESGIARAADRATLLFFLHPKCPCTAASLAELERLLSAGSRSPGSLPKTIIVATVPAGHSPDWLSTRTVVAAERLPAATLFVDERGTEARRFGAAASGTLMWFDEHGRRLYVGGITASRGHEGANVGRDRVADLLRGRLQRADGIPAFGCRLCLPKNGGTGA
jgi:hypothetical protein